MERTRVPERNYFETKLVSGGEFKIIKSAEFEYKVHPDAIRGAITKKQRLKLGHYPNLRDPPPW